MEKKIVVEIITKSLAEYLESRDELVEIHEDTALVGRKAVLDSIGLVNLIVDIEGKMLELNYEISLLSEKAMSQTNSPFRNISTLADFIVIEINEQK
jgi:acyl carrier protein